MTIGIYQNPVTGQVFLTHPSVEKRTKTSYGRHIVEIAAEIPAKERIYWGMELVATTNDNGVSPQQRRGDKKLSIPDDLVESRSRT